MYLMLVAIMIFVAASLSGFFAPPFPSGEDIAQTSSEYTCCDTGDGANCRPRTDKTFQYKGDEYALLKSNTYPISSTHQFDHFEHTDKVVPGVGRVFLNVGNKDLENDRSDECTQNVKDRTDWIRGEADPNDEHGSHCKAIPKGLLIYVCTYGNNQPPGICDQRSLKKKAVTFDVYVRVKDVSPGGNPGKIPDVIANCSKPANPPTPKKQIAFRPSPGGQKNLQLRTFRFVEDEPPVRWLAPYCKPAIYLYPEQKTEVNVSIFPQGKMLLTIPEYPKTGWDVIAEPNGTIHHQDKLFDYLYYEAAIPDELIKKPEKGFIMPYDNRSLFLTDLVTKLGLNEKETQQFVEYWVPILPKSPYYFVGIVPTTTLHDISPLVITPKPDTTLRVTLYFQALEKPTKIDPPLILPFKRSGFTAVEWGGIFKQDTEHPFSCFM